MPSNAEYTDEYLAIIEELGGDVPGRLAAVRYMEGSTAIVHHEVVESTFVPRLYSEATYRTFKECAETMHHILVKVMQHYHDDAAYRKIFTFDSRLEELILLPRGYDAWLPFARVDVFLNEDTGEVAFCELNADGSSGMNEDREVNKAISRSESLQRFSARHRIRPCELFGPWVEEFMAIYGTYAHRVDSPRIAICDFLENAVIDEFEIFAGMFRERGLACTIADVADLTFDGTHLRDGNGEAIDAIWRRSVTNDILDNWDASQALIAAVRAEKVALIGSFAGHLVHDKQIFQALAHPLTKAFLTEEENAFVARSVPATLFLDEAQADIAQIRADKDSWIIKPTDNYGATDVYAGVFYSQKQWDGLIDRYANGRAGGPFLAQRYITPYQTLTLPPDTEGALHSAAGAHPEALPYNNLSGLYLYNGTFTGVFSRLGPKPTISKDMQGITAATIWVDCPR